MKRVCDDNVIINHYQKWNQNHAITNSLKTWLTRTRTVTAGHWQWNYRVISVKYVILTLNAGRAFHTESVPCAEKGFQNYAGWIALLANQIKASKKQPIKNSSTPHQFEIPPEYCPKANSAIKMGIPHTNNITKYGMKKTPPPFWYAKYGKRQTLPSPTQYPMHESRNSNFPPQVSRFSISSP